MIPLASHETVTHKDEDGITWEFVPKYGATEREVLEFFSEENKTVTPISQMEKMAAFIDKILVGWSGGPAGTLNMRKSDEVKCLSAFFSVEEMGQILSMWSKANHVSAQEKKAS